MFITDRLIAYPSNQRGRNRVTEGTKEKDKTNFTRTQTKLKQKSRRQYQEKQHNTSDCYYNFLLSFSFVTNLAEKFLESTPFMPYRPTSRYKNNRLTMYQRSCDVEAFTQAATREKDSLCQRHLPANSWKITTK